MERVSNFRSWKKYEAAIADPSGFALTQILQEPMMKLPRAVELLIIRAACTHSDYFVRDAAVEVLGAYDEPEDEYRLLLATRDPEWIVRCTAVSSLTSYHSKRVKRRLASVAKRGSPGIVRRWAVEAVYDENPTVEIIPFLHELREAEDDPMPLCAIYTSLILLGETNWIAELRELKFKIDVPDQNEKRFLQAIVDDYVDRVSGSEGDKIFYGDA